MKCRYCESENVVKRGISKTKDRGVQQRYLCKSCRKTFVADNGFWKMKYKDEMVAMCVDMYLSNLSSRKMRNQLRRHFGLKVSHVTIMSWIVKYVKRVYDYTERLRPKLGGRVYADETEIHRGGNNDVFWCAVDWDTRYIRATLYSPNPQNMEDAIEFVRKIGRHGIPQYIQTDGLPHYPKAVKMNFGRLRTDHRINNFNKSGKHNVRIETVFMKIKDRIHDFRGLKSLKSAPIILAGIVIQHNFIEAHSTTNRVPCELAGLDIKTGDNRWLDLIRLTTSF